MLRCCAAIIIIVVVVVVPVDSFSDKLSCRHRQLSVGTLRHTTELCARDSSLLLSQRSRTTSGRRRVTTSVVKRAIMTRRPEPAGIKPYGTDERPLWAHRIGPAARRKA